MFSKSQSSQARPAKSQGAQPRKDGATAPSPSIISADMRVAGDLRTEGDIQVDGVVDGDIQSTSVSVGRTAEVNGEIVAETVRIWGKVNGRIRSRDVTLLETAQVHGAILHETPETDRKSAVWGKRVSGR